MGASIMKKSIPDVVLTSLHPKTFYRAKDIANEINIAESSVGAALRELSRGG